MSTNVSKPELLASTSLEISRQQFPNTLDMIENSYINGMCDLEDLTAVLLKERQLSVDDEYFSKLIISALGDNRLFQTYLGIIRQETQQTLLYLIDVALAERDATIAAAAEQDECQKQYDLYEEWAQDDMISRTNDFNRKG